MTAIEGSGRTAHLGEVLTLPKPRTGPRARRRLLRCGIAPIVALRKKITQAVAACLLRNENFAPSRAMRHPPSPCVSVCRIAPDTGWCEGCRRTLEEIADWPMLKPSEKREILSRLPARGSESAAQ